MSRRFLLLLLIALAALTCVSSPAAVYSIPDEEISPQNRTGPMLVSGEMPEDINIPYVGPHVASGEMAGWSNGVHVDVFIYDRDRVPITGAEVRLVPASPEMQEPFWRVETNLTHHGMGGGWAPGDTGLWRLEVEFQGREATPEWIDSSGTDDWIDIEITMPDVVASPMIIGTVTDPLGARVASAEVRLLRAFLKGEGPWLNRLEATDSDAITGDDGSFHFLSRTAQEEIIGLFVCTPDGQQALLDLDLDSYDAASGEIACEVTVADPVSIEGRTLLNDEPWFYYGITAMWEGTVGESDAEDPNGFGMFGLPMRQTVPYEDGSFVIGPLPRGHRWSIGPFFPSLLADDELRIVDLPLTGDPPSVELHVWNPGLLWAEFKVIDVSTGEALATRRDPLPEALLEYCAPSMEPDEAYGHGRMIAESGYLLHANMRDGSLATHWVGVDLPGYEIQAIEGVVDAWPSPGLCSNALFHPPDLAGWAFRLASPTDYPSPDWVRDYASETWAGLLAKDAMIYIRILMAPDEQPDR